MAKLKRANEPVQVTKSDADVAMGEKDETQDKQRPENRTPPTIEEIRRVMSALGKLGGPKGGASRAAKLSKRRRVQIAKEAASVRWAKK